MSLQGTSAIRRQTIYPSECAGVPANHKRICTLPKTRPPVTDAILLDGLRSGNQHAFEEMVRRFGGRLLATARRYLRSEADACDALQDAFLRAFKSIDTFKGDSQRVVISRTPRNQIRVGLSSKKIFSRAHLPC